MHRLLPWLLNHRNPRSWTYGRFTKLLIGIRGRVLEQIKESLTWIWNKTKRIKQTNKKAEIRISLLIYLSKAVAKLNFSEWKRVKVFLRKNFLHNFKFLLLDWGDGLLHMRAKVQVPITNVSSWLSWKEWTKEGDVSLCIQ